jgi:hypothetical protein
VWWLRLRIGIAMSPAKVTLMPMSRKEIIA